MKFNLIVLSKDLKYKILNPKNWEELSYGLHNDLLQCNKKTLVKNATQIKEENTKLWAMVTG